MPRLTSLNSYLSNSSAGTYALSTWTVSAWIKPSEFALPGPIVCNGYSGGSGSIPVVLSLGGRGSTPDVLDKVYVGWFSNPATWNTIPDPEVVKLGYWTHYVGTSAGTVATLYRNGALVAQGTLGAHVLTTVDADLRIGRRWDSAVPTFFPGEIAEVAFWNISMAQSEIVALYQGHSPHRIRPEALSAYWPLNYSGATDKDLGRSSRDMTVTGNPQSTVSPFNRSSFFIDARYSRLPVATTIAPDLSATGTGAPNLYAAYHEFQIPVTATGTATLKRDASTTLNATGTATPAIYKRRDWTLSATGTAVATALHNPVRTLSALGTSAATVLITRFRAFTGVITSIASLFERHRGARPFIIAKAENRWVIAQAGGWSATAQENFDFTAIGD